LDSDWCCIEAAMTKFVAASAAIIGLLASRSAGAADIPAPVYKAPVAVAVYNWTGFYLGGNAGISAGVAPLTQTTAVPPFPPDINNQSTHSAFGAIGGLQAGYNWQAGKSVLGIEGDFQLSGQRSDPTCLTFCDFNFQTPTQIQFDSVAQRIPWFATLRGRLGYAAGPTLFYLTAGAAFADIKTTYGTTEFAAFNGTISDSRVGVAIGGGVEAALSGNWTAKVEYLYLDFGSVSETFRYNAPGGGFGPPGPIPIVSVVSGNVSDHILRAGVNYRFGDPAPATASAMPTKAPPIPPAAYNWSGFYVGGNFGYGVGRNPTTENTFGLFGNSNELFTHVPRGVLGGIQAGYNFMPLNWLALGVEADYQLADQRDTACFSWCFQTNTTYTQSQHWFATARGRVGVAAGPALFYVTGGGAWTAIGTTASQTNSITTIAGTTLFTGSGSFSDQKSGWVVGGGVEGAIGGNWTAKVEYLYLDFGSIAHLYPAAIPTNLADPNIHISSQVRDNVFRAGLNYHFAAAPPIIAASY
jgi:outer membrane immunogenic protein